jgi:hypothetical protein
VDFEKFRVALTIQMSARLPIPNSSLAAPREFFYREKFFPQLKSANGFTLAEKIARKDMRFSPPDKTN